ncbi:MAG: DegV family protein [Peptococcaceae bacterium]|nr:DegV family protein [Peptococcaceae bacterium]
MQDYVLFTDSCSDIPADLAQEFGVIVVPLQFSIDGQDYYDDPLNRDLSQEDFYAKMRQGHRAITAQVTTPSFVEMFEPVLQRGQDLLYLGFSSKISGTYSSSYIAAQELAPKYPDRTILTIDTKTASTGLTLLLDLAHQQKKQGKTIQELYDWVLAQLPHISHWFTVDDLIYLKRGGRVSSFEAVIGKTLNIKPIIHVDNEGALIPVGKVRGRRQSLDTLVRKVVDFCVDPTQPVYIAHADAYEDALAMEKSLRACLPVQDVHIDYIGPVIGAHVGPGAVTLFFVGKER